MDMFSIFSEEKKENSVSKHEEKVAIYDIETQRSADEVGWNNIDLMYMSVGVVHLLPEDKTMIFYENEAEKMVELLTGRDRIVSYNGLHFDNKVLSYYTDIDLWNLPNTDMMLDINDALGRERSIPLDNIATATLGGRGKSADPLQVFEWYKTGQLDKIASYCSNDVLITKDVFVYGNVHGEIYFKNRNDKRLAIPISWTIRRGQQ